MYDLGIKSYKAHKSNCISDLCWLFSHFKVKPQVYTNMLDGLSLVLYIIKLQYKDHQETITCWRPIPFVTQSEQNIYPMSLQCNSDNKNIWFHLCPLMSIVRIQIQTTVDIWRFLLRCLVYKEKINFNAYADI